MAPSATGYSEDQSTIDIFPTKHENGAGGRELSRKITTYLLKERIRNFNVETSDAGEGDAFFVADMGDVYRQHMRWKMNLPRVKPHYAVKCNPDREVLRLLAELGTGFDCASRAEIEMIMSLGVDPSRIIYANPTKDSTHLNFAARVGVKQVTFDNSDELHKLKARHPSAELFIRITTDDSGSLCSFKDKFGASLDITKNLLATAKSLGLNVVGVSFHVGSGDADPYSPSKAAAFVKAVHDARLVFDQAAVVGYDLKTLDIGGGFSGDRFEVVAETLSPVLDNNFPPSIRIISEPGRYYVSSAFTLANRIIGADVKRSPSVMGMPYKLTLNDGVYGNFAAIFYDHMDPVPQILSKRNPSNQSTNYMLWGQTCDGLDAIKESYTLNGLLNEGDWLFFEEMGAYTKCCAMSFNGFTDAHDVVYVSSVPGASALLGYTTRLSIGGVGRAKV